MKKKTWRDEKSPIEYAHGAIEELKRQLASARTAKRKLILQSRILEWEKKL